MIKRKSFTGEVVGELMKEYAKDLAGSFLETRLGRVGSTLRYRWLDALDEPRVYVVIPALNEEKYIEKAVRSVKEQSYKSDVIVVDNGSTDKTAELATKAGARVVKSEKGLCKARNRGAYDVLNDADIVVWMDSDSWMAQDLIEKIVDSAKKGCVGGIARMTPEDPAYSAHFGLPQTVYRNSILLNRVSPKVKPLALGALIYARADVARRMLENDGYMFQEELEYGEASEFVQRLSRYGWTDFIADSSITTSVRRMEKQSPLGSWSRDLYRHFSPPEKWPEIREDSKGR